MSFKSISTTNLSIAEARKAGLAYVDKTMYIPQLESGAGSNVLLFLRPPSFGKTFLAGTLDCYYDRSLSSRFDENFGGTWILSHKTPRAGSYCCLRFDFSPAPDPGLAEESFAGKVALGIMDFSGRYPSIAGPFQGRNQIEPPFAAIRADGPLSLQFRVAGSQWRKDLRDHRRL